MRYYNYRCNRRRVQAFLGSIPGLAQLYQLAPSNGNFLGVPAQKRESNQQPPIANRL